MKNKFIIIFILLIFILFIPSFSQAVEYDDNGTTITLPDFNMPSGTTDYVLFTNSHGYRIYGFKDKESASKCFLWYSGSDIMFKVPSGLEYWFAALYNTLGYWDKDFFGKPCFTWLTSDGPYGDSFPSGLKENDFHAVYTTFDVKYENGDIAFEDSTKLKLNLSINPEGETKNVPVLITSDWYLLEKWNTSLEVSTENQMYDVYLHIPQVDNPVRN